MPAAAEVDECPLAIKRKRRLIGQSILDVLDLEFLAQFAAKLQRSRARLLDPLERSGGRDGGGARRARRL